MQLPEIPQSLFRHIQDQDVEVLRAKFNETDNLVKTFENAMTRFHAYVSTQAICHEKKDQLEIIRAVREGLMLVSSVGAAQSLIAADLAAVRAGLRQNQLGREDELGRSVIARLATIKRLNKKKDKMKVFCEVLSIARDLHAIMKVGLEPAIVLRKVFEIELTRHARSSHNVKEGTPKQQARERMRLRIQELSKQWPAYPDLLRHGRVDSTIQECMNTGLRFTKDVIRHTLKPHRARSPKTRQNQI